MKEVVKDNETGFLVLSGDIYASADRAAALLTNPKLYRQFSESSKAFWLESFSPSRTVPIWLEAFEKVLDVNK